MFSYYFNEPMGPTESSLSLAFQTRSWKAETCQPLFSQNSLLNDESLQTLEHKHKLARYFKQHHLQFMPETYIVDELNLHSVLKKIKQCNNRWILKPAMLNNGKGIVLLENSDEIEKYFQQTSRFGGVHILQRYIESPMLYHGQRKFSLRFFVVMTTCAQAFLYHQGYLNVCESIYEPKNFLNVSAHLTNEHLKQDGAINNQQILFDTWQRKQTVFQKVFHQCEALLQPFFEQINTSGSAPKFAVLGIDFMLDQAEQLWLLEVNHGPCFPTSISHPLFQSLYQPFWCAVVKDVIEPFLIQKSPNEDNHFSKIASA